MPQGLAKGVSAKQTGSMIHWICTIIQHSPPKRLLSNTFYKHPPGSVRLGFHTGVAQREASEQSTLPAVGQKKVKHHRHTSHSSKAPRTSNNINTQQVLCIASAGKHTSCLKDKAIRKSKLLHQLPATTGEEMVGHKALKSVFLHVKYLKNSIRLSDRRGY